MTLQELKHMVAEEYAKFNRQINEQPAPGGPGPKEPNIAVSDTDIDVDGGGEDNAEDTLKDIYDMLKDFFEGGDDAKDDAKDDDKDEEEVSEISIGANSGYKSIKESVRKKRTKANLIKEMKSKNFKSRLQKLANIK